MIENELTIRLTCFFGIFAVMALWEVKSPRRPLSLSRKLRWSNNLGLIVVNSVLLRLFFPAAAVGFALQAEAKGWGLFNEVSLPTWIVVLCSIILLDLAIYWQHRLFHRIPMLWQYHQVHHADLDYDVTTATRFHPIEILLSMVIKMVAITLIGAPALAVMLFEIILNGCAMFNHGNVQLPSAVDKIVRTFLVTPDMHRVHHSVVKSEHDSNYGFNLSIWDRLFGTYVAQPAAGHLGMKIGLDRFRDPKNQMITALLRMPFSEKKAQK
ncbi:MAG: sterol desaturase family protein [Gammaproteobacteria bacterium]|nr:MAG: sterol desaturase family protein [Gammaproteobacteria bacterium]RLA22224.1 MAG: sterol desaturase family protein [Gammaproteobacteria bacterium]